LMQALRVSSRLRRFWTYAVDRCSRGVTPFNRNAGPTFVIRGVLTISWCGGAVAIDPDIERAARFLISKHGASTALEIAKTRVSDLEKAGDVRAAALWKQIVERIEAIVG
jgi:hypothetical protein